MGQLAGCDIYEYNKIILDDSKGELRMKIKIL